MRERARRILAALTHSPRGLFGTVLAGGSGFMIVTLLTYDIVGGGEHPYLGIITYMVLPLVFLVGFLLVLSGIRKQTKARLAAEAGGEAEPEFPVIDLNDDRTRTVLLAAGGFGAFAAVLLATTTIKGVEYVDSNQFCGTTCHVMEPEWTAYQRSPHARVHCVQCHVGEGAGNFVQAKLSGVRQVIALATGSYNRPIPTPVHNLRPARATCNECHWPTKFHGVRTKVITRFRSDSANTETQTIIVNKVGGGQEIGVSEGVHWHVDPSLEVRYRSDESREYVEEIETVYPDGSVRVYHRAPPADAPAAESWRTMDCIDCHNRPTHVYLSAQQAVDEVLQLGILSRSLPYIRREGLKAVRDEYASHEAARVGIRERIEAFYAESYPDLAADQASLVRDAAETLGDVYATNVFPAMNVDWNTYENHLGHIGMEGGCFRCHSDAFESEDGRRISTSCDLCHQIVAYEQPREAVDLLSIRP
ncbi:MAG: NapC/NirT family cytochrome c [Gemmatimonadota bacterium]|nr:NapC/NirT family cytochrome c [Gemmatimonadota bacterium]